jgi:DNA-binding transcriptional ArsR family regulator
MALLALTAATQAPHGMAALATGLDPSPAAMPMGPFLALAPLLVLGLLHLTPAGAADYPVRRRLLAAFAEGRCHTASELARLVGVSRKTVDYHLRILVRAGLAVRRDLGRPLYAGAAHARTALPASWLLGHPHRRALWEAAQATPGATIPDLAKATGLRPGTAHFHAAVLRKHGLLEVRHLDGLRGLVAVPLGQAGKGGEGAPGEADAPA